MLLATDEALICVVLLSACCYLKRALKCRYFTDCLKRMVLGFDGGVYTPTQFAFYFLCTTC